MDPTFTLIAYAFFWVVFGLVLINIPTRADVIASFILGAIWPVVLVSWILRALRRAAFKR